MIILNLCCDHGHRFEGWFASTAAFDEQCARGLVQCTLCQSRAVTRLPSAPRVKRHGTTAAEAPMPSALVSPGPEDAGKLFQMLATLARQAEDVGAEFPEEARRIHYDEAPARTIRGQASREETRELLEEGILVLPAPVPPERDTH